MTLAALASDTRPPATGEADIAQIGAVLADRSRCQILLALFDGRALPASVLADEAGVSRATGSAHLARLLEAGFVRVEARGRHRYYRIAGPAVGELVERLGQLAPAKPIRSLREETAPRGCALAALGYGLAVVSSYAATRKG